MAVTFPINVDTVVVQHYWWDDATRAGVAGQVSWTPIGFLGAGTPNLIDQSARGWVKTRAWKSTPDPVSGYHAVPLTSSNDPDLSGFVGYRVEPSGETAFTIAVDVAAPTVSATAEMAAALAALIPPVTVSVGQQVKAVWLTDVALIAPSPTPPASFYTAAQTTNLVLDAVAAHDTDPSAHPDIRALISTSGGSSGSGGATTDQLTGTRIASTIMSGHRVVSPTSTGSVEYADNATVSHRSRPMWLTMGAASSGGAVQVLYTGPVTEPSWSWTAGPVYLGTNGALTQAPPTPPSFLAQIGYATSATTLWLERQPTYVLAN